MFKKGLVTSFVLGLLLTAIILILLIYFFVGFFDNPQKKYDNSAFLCKMSFSQMPARYENKDLFFEYFETSKEMCVTKTVETEFVVREIADLLDSCWYRTGEGEDFLPNLITNISLCVYCGSVVAKNDGNLAEPLINLLKTQKYSNLFETSEIDSTNIYYLLDDFVLPQTYSQGEEFGVFFYVFRPQIDSLGANIKRFLREESSLYRELSSLSSSKIESMGGVVLTNIETREEMELGTQINIASEVDIGGFNCDYLVLPNEHVKIS